MALKCSFEVVCLIASVDHLFGLLLEHVVLAVRTCLAFWLGLAAGTILRAHLRILRILHAAEKSSDVVLLVAVVEEGDFGFVGRLRRYGLLLHGFGWLSRRQLRLSSLQLF